MKLANALLGFTVFMEKLQLHGVAFSVAHRGDDIVDLDVGGLATEEGVSVDVVLEELRKAESG